MNHEIYDSKVLRHIRSELERHGLKLSCRCEGNLCLFPYFVGDVVMFKFSNDILCMLLNIVKRTSDHS